MKPEANKDHEKFAILYSYQSCVFRTNLEGHRERANESLKTLRLAFSSCVPVQALESLYFSELVLLTPTFVQQDGEVSKAQSR
jgi:hypothetical protein